MPKSASRPRSTRDETLERNPGALIADLDGSLEPASPTVHRSHRRPFGVHPVPLLGAVGGLALLAAIILLAAGAIVGGLALLIVALPLLGLFAGGVIEDPDAPAAGRSLQLAHRMRSLAGLLAVGVRAEGRAGVGLARAQVRQTQLRRELKATMAPLGEAVHRGDKLRADELHRRATDLERELGELQHEAARLAADAREELAHERATLEPTRAVSSAAAPRSRERAAQ
jgi:hypothetical protein